MKKNKNFTYSIYIGSKLRNKRIEGVEGHFWSCGAWGDYNF